MRYFITGQSMNMPSVGPTVHTASELEVMIVMTLIVVTT